MDIAPAADINTSETPGQGKVSTAVESNRRGALLQIAPRIRGAKTHHLSEVGRL